MKKLGLHWMNGHAALLGAALPLLGSAVAFADESTRASASNPSRDVRYVLSSVALTGEVSRSHGPVPTPACATTSSPVALVSNGTLEITLGAGVLLASGEPAGASGSEISGASKCRASLDVAFPAGTYPERFEIGFFAGLVKGSGSRMGAAVQGTLAGIPLVEASRELKWGSVYGDPLLTFSATRIPNGDAGVSSQLRALVCAARGQPIALGLDAQVDVQKSWIGDDARLGLENGDVRVTFKMNQLRRCP